MTDYFYRIEFQHRGSPHAHFLVWIKDAPKLRSSEDYEIIENYVDRHISCSLDVPQNIREFVNYQIHKHSKTCRKEGKAICRFDFPIPPMRQTTILQPLGDNDDKSSQLYKTIKHFLDTAECQVLSFDQMLKELNITENEYIKAIRSSLADVKIFLKRTPAECRVNGYMKSLVGIWQANHDIQFILNAEACAQYIVGYINKQNRGLSMLLSQIKKECRSKNSDVKDQLKSISHAMVKCTEVSAQECAYILLVLPMTKLSVKVIFLNNLPKRNRMRLLKHENELNQMDDLSTDIFMSNYIEKYEKRPDFFSNWSLADYTACVGVKEKKNRNVNKICENDVEEDLSDDEISVTTSYLYSDRENEYYRKKKPFVIRYVKYKKEQDKENYYRSLLFLFHPWRRERDAFATESSYEEMYTDLTKTSLEKLLQCKNRYDTQSLENIEDQLLNIEQGTISDNVCPQIQSEEMEAENEGSQMNNDMFFFIPPAVLQNIENVNKNVESDMPLTVSAIIESLWPKKQLDEMIAKLNRKQREIYNHVMLVVTNTNQRLRLFITGGAGVGKSVVLKSVYQSLIRYYNLSTDGHVNDCSVVCAAPTGKAAYLIRGTTLHSAFNIIPNRSKTYARLTHEKLNSYQVKYEHLKILLIDEIYDFKKSWVIINLLEEYTSFVLEICINYVRLWMDGYLMIWNMDIIYGEMNFHFLN